MAPKDQVCIVPSLRNTQTQRVCEGEDMFILLIVQKQKHNNEKEAGKLN